MSGERLTDHQNGGLEKRTWILVAVICAILLGVSAIMFVPIKKAADETLPAMMVEQESAEIHSTTLTLRGTWGQQRMGKAAMTFQGVVGTAALDYTLWDGMDELDFTLSGEGREYGLLGKNIFGTDFCFDVDVRLGAGAFVCGEETALMTSIEGKRGEPRPRPPFPAVKGLFEKPTILNNVETYANVPQIINNGWEWFASIGTEKSKGTKVFALGGKISNTGLVEVPMGTTLREIIYDIGGGCPNGKKFKAAQTGGPSGGCIPASQLDVQIDYDNLTAIGSMMGSGGMIVMDEDTCMVDIARFFLDFTVDESCGKCAPCRIGTKRMLEILERIVDGRGEDGDIEKLEELAKAIKATALCGLGQTAPNPVLSTMKYFRDEYIAHIRDKTCPAGVCKALIRYAIDPDKGKGGTKGARACPAGAISGQVRQPHKIDTKVCIKCGLCMQNCAFGAVYTK